MLVEESALDFLDLDRLALEGMSVDLVFEIDLEPGDDVLFPPLPGLLRVTLLLRLRLLEERGGLLPSLSN